MIPNIRVLYSLRKSSTTLAYMLQSSEYDLAQYFRWFWRTQDFSRIMYRRTLDATRVAQLLKLFLMVGMLLQILGGLLCIVLWHRGVLDGGGLFGLALILSYPVVWAHLVVAPLWLGRELILKPRQRRQISASARLFADHPAVKIAVAGSYGKTSMKELLNTVLSVGKRVAVTPANKNVAISHAQFAGSLKGDEEVLVIEYGEGQPGDVRRFTAVTNPSHGIITGLAPAHLDKYKTIQAAGEDIFSLADYLHGRNIYVNGEGAAIKPFLKKSYEMYGAHGALGWKVSDVKLSLEGTTFTLAKGKQRLVLKSGLLGMHNVGPLSLAVALAIELGLSLREVEKGIAATAPFEHRMQPYQLGAAWIIDDTYNGNLEGVRAGTELLALLTAKRKLYITPGLVDQGDETQTVHEAVGRYIAQAQPDVVVLMHNTVTRYIQSGLQMAHYAGEVRIEHEPLRFYQNLKHHVAAGDLVMMQNDWTDNYA